MYILCTLDLVGDAKHHLFPHYFTQLLFTSVTPAAWFAKAGPLRLAYLPV